MSRIAMTGANGFLGWHTRLALRQSGVEVDPIQVGDLFDLSQATASVSGAQQVIHIAGVNRATDAEIESGNLRFAEQLSHAIRCADTPPAMIVYANSTQISNGSVYGKAKRQAGELLAKTAAGLGIEFRNVVLPNLFGEHGRPFYNAVTPTFCHLLAQGEVPEIQDDKQLVLLHAQNAADLLTGRVPTAHQAELQVHETVSGLLRRLQVISKLYAFGEIPDVSTAFDRDLFNTYRSYSFENRPLIPLTRHADERGSFFEIIRSHAGTGQSSFSTTELGVTRGDHFHLRKIERFTVLSGTGTISMRRLFTDDVVSFSVNGLEPVAIDMPTGWAHNITNTGDDILYTSFWTNDIFDPENPDTIAEAV